MRALLTVLLLSLTALPAGAAQERLLAFGDSITVGLGDGNVSCSGQGGYPGRLRSRLINRGRDVEILNRGLCNERTGGGVSRIDQVLAEGGDVILIMEGTNDIAHRVSRPTIRFNLEQMVQKALDAGIVPLLSSVIPRGPGVIQDPNNVKTELLAIELRQDAQAAGIPFADPFFDLINIPNLFQTYYSDALHPNAAGYGLLVDTFENPAITALDMDITPALCAQVPPGPCVASDTVLCLTQGRFRVESQWDGGNGRMGVGHAVPQTDDTGAFFWTHLENIEVIVKVLDGRNNNGHFWVFYGALSNLEYSLVVTDTQTGDCKEYFNPQGNFASVGDTAAF